MIVGYSQRLGKDEPAFVVTSSYLGAMGLQRSQSVETGRWPRRAISFGMHDIAPPHFNCNLVLRTSLLPRELRQAPGLGETAWAHDYCPLLWSLRQYRSAAARSSALLPTALLVSWYPTL